MKPIKSLLVLAIMLAPGLVAAQGYYGSGPGYYNQPNRIPGGFHDRTGRLAFGGSLGLGGMHDEGSGITSCDNCANAPAFEGDLHIGGMITPRFALLFEAQANGRTVHSDLYNGDTVMTQTAAMLAGQLWLTPQLWVKGGIGVSQIQLDDAYGTYGQRGTGVALMGAVGFELLSARFFAVDLQGRLIEGGYDSLNDNITAANVGIGINWY